MKKAAILLSLSFLFFSCNNSQKHHSNTANADGHFDVICDMTEGDIPWTEFSVYETDTFWFCSPVCLETFEKEPAKYAKK